MSKRLQLPTPPVPYYPPPPEEPRWNQERQSSHARSLRLYIGALLVWVELCRSQMRFGIDMGLPVASSKDWDSFFSQSKEYIGDLMKMLQVWSSDPTEPDEDITIQELPAVLEPDGILRQSSSLFHPNVET